MDLSPGPHAQLTILPLLGSLEHALKGPYQLLVQVKDMGDQVSGHQATATVEISILENTWVPLEPTHLAENLKVPYPHVIAQVSKWLSAAAAAPWMGQLGLIPIDIWEEGLGPNLTLAPFSNLPITSCCEVGSVRPWNQVHTPSTAILWHVWLCVLTSSVFLRLTQGEQLAPLAA
jgi:hypothetical protein